MSSNIKDETTSEQTTLKKVKSIPFDKTPEKVPTPEELHGVNSTA